VLIGCVVSDRVVSLMLTGDFAMLLNAGMSAKQALVYNCMSSLLCMLGMVFGVAVGNISSATSWIFALIAGLFLYVALVDMVPTSLLTRYFYDRLHNLLISCPVFFVLSIVYWDVLLETIRQDFQQTFPE